MYYQTIFTAIKFIIYFSLVAYNNLISVIDFFLMFYGRLIQILDNPLIMLIVSIFGTAYVARYLQRPKITFKEIDIYDSESLDLIGKSVELINDGFTPIMVHSLSLQAAGQIIVGNIPFEGEVKPKSNLKIPINIEEYNKRIYILKSKNISSYRYAIFDYRYRKIKSQYLDVK